MLNNKEIDSSHSLGGVESSFADKNNDISYKYDKLIDKSISILRIAMIRLSDLILELETNENTNWLLHELMMQHRIILHQQIDQLIKQKNKMLKKP
jgi:hypothetical protein